MSEDTDREGGYGDGERIKAWLEGWGQYFWAILAIAFVLFLLVNIITGLI